MSQQQPTEEELRAALEAELKRVTVDDVILQSIVSLINVAGRRAGLVAGSEDERDFEQVKIAIEAVRGLVGLIEQRHGDELAPIRDALSRLQMAYVAEREGGGEAGAEPGSDEAASGEQGAQGAGPAQSSGRLWVPDQ